MRTLKSHDRGNVLIMSIAIVLIVSLVLLSLVRRFQFTAKQGVRTASEESALMLARQGIARGLWYLQTNIGTFQKVKNGQTITDYDGTKKFNNNIYNIWGVGLNTQVQGNYTVQFQSGADSKQIVIVAVGYPTSNATKASVTATYEDVSVNSAVYVESDQSKVDWSVASTFDCQAVGAHDWLTTSVTDAPQIHWGPVKSLRGMNVTNGPLFPRKYASNNIIPRYNGSPSYNSDEVEYWANTKDIDPPPIFDFPVMKQQAQTSMAYYGASTYISSAAIVSVSSNVASLYLAQSTTWYYDCNLVINGPVYYRGIVIVMGDLTINAGATGANQSMDMANAPVPVYVSTEYAASGGYPVDSYLASSLYLHSFDVNTIGMRAFVYVNGNVYVNGVAAPDAFFMYGSLYVKGRFIAAPTSNFRVYYGASKYSPPIGGDQYIPWPLVLSQSWRKINWDERIVF